MILFYLVGTAALEIIIVIHRFLVEVVFSNMMSINLVVSSSSKQLLSSTTSH